MELKRDTVSVNLKRIFSLIVLFFFSASCSNFSADPSLRFGDSKVIENEQRNEEDSGQNQTNLEPGSPGDLHASQFLKTVTATEFFEGLVDQKYEELLDLNGVTSAPVDIYSVQYWSKSHLNEPVLVSGGIYIPETIKSQKIIVYSHATIKPSENASVPSRGKGSEPGGIVYLASLGYIVISSDYLGYGVSQERRHPYLNVLSHAADNYNMLLASRKVLTNLGQEFDPNEVISLGYSQGGAAGLAFHYYVDEISTDNTKIAFGSYGGGPYDLFEIFKKSWQVNLIGEPQLAVWVLGSLNLDYSLGYKNENLFLEPFRNQISFEPLAIPTLPPELDGFLQKDFFDSLVDGKELKMKMALDEQSVYKNWAPQSDVFIYHGQSDLVVPDIGAEFLYDDFVSKDVSVLFLRDGSDHSGGVAIYLTMVTSLLQKDGTLKNLLEELAENQVELEIDDPLKSESLLESLEEALIEKAVDDAKEELEEDIKSKVPDIF